MAKEDKDRTKEKGGLCCDHCSDSKFPCVFMENKMKREPRGKAKEDPVKTEE